MVLMENKRTYYIYITYFVLRIIFYSIHKTLLEQECHTCSRKFKISHKNAGLSHQKTQNKHYY